MTIRCNDRRARSRSPAFTLVEAVIATAIAAFSLGMIIVAYTQTARRAEWAGYSLAAQAMAIQQVEQARAAVWDPSLSKNEITNLALTNWTYTASTREGKGYSWATLDLPIQGTNVMRVTNYVTVRALYLNGTTNPPVEVQMVQVDTVWRFRVSPTYRLFTNTVCTYLAPDNRDANTL